MDWITKEYVKAEAKKGRKQAIECTRLHWLQLVLATPEELDEGYYGKVSLLSSYCAMCYRYLSLCSKCLLKCEDTWLTAYHTMHRWKERPTQRNWRKWKTAARAMLAKIDRLHEGLYGSKK